MEMEMKWSGVGSAKETVKGTGTEARAYDMKLGDAKARTMLSSGTRQAPVTAGTLDRRAGQRRRNVVGTILPVLQGGQHIAGRWQGARCVWSPGVSRANPWRSREFVRAAQISNGTSLAGRRISTRSVLTCYVSSSKDPRNSPPHAASSLSSDGQPTIRFVLRQEEDRDSRRGG